ncbi:MAG TPA: S-layer homology domain-containing protein [Bacilli bacterium]
MRKLFFLIATFAMLFTAILPAQAATEESKTFSDIANHWAKNAILLAVQKGYVSGFPDGTFQPNKQVTRAEFIKMLVDALKLPHSQGGKPWYQPYVAAALEMGLLHKEEFADYNANISRLEILRLSARGLATNKAYDAYLQAFSGLYNGDIPYIDWKKIKTEDVPNVALVIGTGIVSGYPDFSLGVEKTATRAEAVTMIENLLEVQLQSPEHFRGLKELKEVAETGTNATTVTDYVKPYMNFKKDPVIAETYKYTARLNRVYVLPVEGEPSIFDRKLRWDRKNQNDDYIKQQKALMLVSFVIKTKSSFALNSGNYSTFLYPNGLVRTSDGVPFRTAEEKFGYLSYSPVKLIILEANKTYEIFSTSTINDSLDIYGQDYTCSVSSAYSHWKEYYQIPVFENEIKKSIIERGYGK